MDFLTRHEIEPTFRGKTVAIVGSGPSCLSNPEGLIDGHDVVVRVNNYKIVPERTGSRTDVFYSFFGLTIRKGVRELLNDGVTLCMNKYPNAEPIDSAWHRKRNRRRGVEFWRVYDERKRWWFCPTHEPSVEEFMGDFHLLGEHVPTTGFSAIREVLRCEPASIYLTGFDFFESGIHNVDQPWRAMNHDDPIGHRPMLERDWLQEHWRDCPLTGDQALVEQIGTPAVA